MICIEIERGTSVDWLRKQLVGISDDATVGCVITSIYENAAQIIIDSSEDSGQDYRQHAPMTEDIEATKTS